MRPTSVTAALLMLLLGAGSAAAIDHKNLDEGRPLRLDDAYSISAGEIAVEAGAGFRLMRRSADQGVFPVELLYGALPNLQVGIATTLFTDPHEVDDRQKSGDVHVSGLYNFNQETLSLPAFGIKLSLDLPTGVDAHGYDIEVKGIVTKSFGRLSLHLNAGYEFVTDADSNDRDGRYKLALGFSYPVGAPQFTRATLVGDVFAEQSGHRRASTTVGTEMGLRYQLTPRVVWDIGIGTEFAGPSNRSQFFGMTGLSFGF
jgi:Putative MetA-pathway of phenol degradation